MSSSGFFTLYSSSNSSFVEVRFDDTCHDSRAEAYLSTGLQLLYPKNIVEHLCSTAKPVRIHDPLLLSYQTEDWLFAAIWVNEQNYQSLELAAEEGYSKLINHATQSRFNYLVRVWNYLADINLDENGLERYRRFCVGRFNAFERAGITESEYPAACALGHSGGDLLIYLLANKNKPLHLENPIQTKAYEYPNTYGPRSPSFARASIARVSSQEYNLYLSGTASVIGFVTQHPYDLEAQITTTLSNIDALIDHAKKTSNEYTGISNPIMEPQVIKVYLRHPEDLPKIKNSIEQRFAPDKVVYVKADICRIDLMLEIDGIWRLSQ